jgi:hypothetical protein
MVGRLLKYLIESYFKNVIYFLKYETNVNQNPFIHPTFILRVNDFFFVFTCIKYIEVYIFIIYIM